MIAGSGFNVLNLVVTYGFSTLVNLKLGCVIIFALLFKQIAVLAV